MTMPIEFVTSEDKPPIKAKVQKNFWLLKENHDYLQHTSKRLGVTQTGLINVLISRMRDREENDQPILTIREDQDLVPNNKEKKGN
tara:strand:+ start:15692 stop:15949 length:258 start_codon:yes stop_codon:yes gene_type:complete